MGLYHAGSTARSLEDLNSGSSFLHTVHPASKIITTFVYIVTVVSFGRHELRALLAYLFYPAVAAPLVGIPYSLLFKRLAAALPFALFGGIANLFFERDIFANLLNIPITFGMVSFLVIMLKTVLTVSAMLIFVATTSVCAISGELMRFKTPPIIVASIAMIYRYITVLLEETVSMYTAYKLRSPVKRKSLRIKDMGSFVGSMLLRSFERAQRVYFAMKMRSFSAVYMPRRKVVAFKDVLYTIIFSATTITYACYRSF